MLGQIDSGEANSVGLFQKLIWLQRGVGGAANGVNVCVQNRAGHRLRIHRVSSSRGEGIAQLIIRTGLANSVSSEVSDQAAARWGSIHP